MESKKQTANKKVIRLGIFGLGRGGTFLKSVLLNNGEVVAMCDWSREKMENMAKELPEAPAMYTDFDEFIEHDMDAVFLANCFHEHAQFAIRALEKGLHVMTECTSNATMAEGVALVRAVEKSGCVFALAENYPYMLFNQEMSRVCKEGTLGKIIYAEGEYNHPFNFNDTETHRILRPYARHWRNYLPRSYYITHSLAPLMAATGAIPRRVSAYGVFAPFEEFDYCGNNVADRAAIITCLNDDDSVFRVTGCAAFGAHGNSYRFCGTKGQIENLRGMGDTVMLRYNSWEIPEGKEEVNRYTPEWPESIRDLAEKAGHGGGDYFVIGEFFDSIRNGTEPVFDVYRATAMSSVGILAHRSLLEKGQPYDIPDFRKEEDRVKYEKDDLTPFPGPDGSEPTLPVCSHPDYQVDERRFNNYLEITGEKK